MSIQLSRTRWFVFAGVALASVAAGFTGAKILANETIGYLAGFTWFGLMVIAVPLVLTLLVLGAVLSFISRTRWLGVLCIMSAVLIVGSSVASFKILDAFGEVRYKHEQMVSIGPDVRHDLVIFFKVDSTHDEIESFWTEVLSYPTQGGHWHRPGVGRVLRSQAVEGHESVAVAFFPNATNAEREDVKSRIYSSPIVYKVIENVVPQDIKKLD
jgi:hypothetical protein